MTIADFFTAMGAGGLLGGGFSVVELVIAGVMTFLLIGSLALCIIAMRAANSARAARGEAFDALAELREQKAEFRALASELEKTASDLAASQAELKQLQAAAASAQMQAAEIGEEAPGAQLQGDDAADEAQQTAGEPEPGQAEFAEQDHADMAAVDDEPAKRSIFRPWSFFRRD